MDADVAAIQRQADELTERVAAKRAVEAKAAGEECFQSLGAILKLNDECHALRTELGPEEHRGGCDAALGLRAGPRLGFGLGSGARKRWVQRRADCFVARTTIPTPESKDGTD